MLPSNLADTPDWQYNNVGAWSGGLTPELNEDGYYHLGSRNPITGEILKPKTHPTYQKAIENDIAAGYYPYEKNGRTYTKTYSPTGDLSGYADGTEGIKYYGAYSPEQQAYVLPVYNDDGENNVILPEVTITPQNNTDLGEYMQKKDIVKDIIDFTPVGDVGDVYSIGKDVYEGNYA
nr:MAG TPA: hypothetical protein [Caudoviricetes sp.]